MSEKISQERLKKIRMWGGSSREEYPNLTSELQRHILKQRLRYLFFEWIFCKIFGHGSMFSSNDNRCNKCGNYT